MCNQIETIKLKQIDKDLLGDENKHGPSCKGFESITKS